MFESSKANFLRRMHEKSFRERYFVGEGIDIGAGANPLNYMMLDCWNQNGIHYIQRGNTTNKDLPHITHIDIYSQDWDKRNNAEDLLDRVERTYDFVYSSNLLEHVIHFERALLDFSVICREGGYVISVIPDFELYEKEIWPPKDFNLDHKHCFSLCKSYDIKEHINIFKMIKNFYNLELVNAQTLDTNYEYNRPTEDQTTGIDTESFVEFVCKKKKGSYKNYETLTVKEFDSNKDYNSDILVIPDRDLSKNEQKRIDNLPRTDTYLPLADNFQDSPITYPMLYNVDYLSSLYK